MVCVFLLVLSVLVVCTCLSGNIEREMTAQVAAVTISGTTNTPLPISAASWDEEGSHVYELVEGTSLESGLRAGEISSDEYTVAEEGILFRSGIRHRCILYASKSITEGSLVEIVQDRPVQNYYLLISQKKWEELPEKPGKMEVVKQEGRAALLKAEDSDPYLEARFRASFDIRAEDELYSISVIQQFFDNLPLLAAAFSVLLGYVFSLISLCKRICGGRRDKNLLAAVGMGVVFLGAFFYLNSRIHFPSQMMPEDNIFAVEHYRQELTRIFQSLPLLEHPILSELQNRIIRRSFESGGIILVGIVFCAGGIGWRKTK